MTRPAFLRHPLPPAQAQLAASVAHMLTEPTPDGQPALLEPGDDRALDFGMLVVAMAVGAGWQPPA